MAYYLKTPGVVGNKSPTKAVQIPVSTGAGDSPPVLQDGMLRYNSINNSKNFRND